MVGVWAGECGREGVWAGGSVTSYITVAFMRLLRDGEGGRPSEREKERERKEGRTDRSTSHCRWEWQGTLLMLQYLDFFIEDSFVYRLAKERLL